MLSSCVCMCVETTALFSETIRHSLGPGCKSQGIPPPASTSPEQTTDVCAVTPSFLLGFCGCHSVSHAFVTSTTQPLNSHLGSASEATLPWARDITFLRPAFSVNWRYYDLSGEVVVGLMGWNIDASPRAFAEAWVAWMHWLQEESMETGRYEELEDLSSRPEKL